VRQTGLERISTAWTLVRQAQAIHSHPEAAREAQTLLIERYRRAVYRYLLGAVRDPEQAEELFQEFAFRFVRGDFRNAAPSAGRFRDYLRTSLSHLINDYRRARRNSPGPLPDDAQLRQSEELDPFLAAWRAEVIEQAWSALKAENQTQYAVLNHYAENPDTTAAVAVGALTGELGCKLTASNLRVTLHRARQRLAELIMAEVSATMNLPSQRELTEELRVLNLLKLCSSALTQRYVGSGDIVAEHS
jgi:RNA polymerase sigma-70 factor (ECF subfamily)